MGRFHVVPSKPRARFVMRARLLRPPKAPGDARRAWWDSERDLRAVRA
jgi:hypothetical protein